MDYGLLEQVFQQEGVPPEMQLVTAISTQLKFGADVTISLAKLHEELWEPHRVGDVGRMLTTMEVPSKIELFEKALSWMNIVMTDCSPAAWEYFVVFQRIVPASAAYFEPRSSIWVGLDRVAHVNRGFDLSKALLSYDNMIRERW